MNKLYNKSDYSRSLTESSKGNDPRSNYRRDYARLIHSASFRRLVGKTQLFPGYESDYFRNRLTHSLEVAQIAKTIALKFNTSIKFFKEQNIDYDLIEFAALAHDLGHPPFGHIGEKALDDSMKSTGGFEGNAHTLRLLSVIEKKVKDPTSNNLGFSKTGEDKRFGLNLTYRSLAAILKYDQLIPAERAEHSSLAKGYYETEQELVYKIKKAVTGDSNYSEFRTLECDIMDISDDIAYSTFDLDDAIKANFIHPLDFITVENKIIENILTKIKEKKIFKTINEDRIKRTLQEIIGPVIDPTSQISKNRIDLRKSKALVPVLGLSYLNAKMLDNGYNRNAFTSSLINEFIGGISVKVNKECPAMSKISVQDDVLLKIEVLKHFIFYSITMSPRLSLPEYRGYEIVKGVFDIIANEKSKLLANDYKQIYNDSTDNKKRIVCDFVAGMTDRYVIEFYGRLKSENPQTIFKPL